MRLASDFILKPIISEKSFAEAKGDKYTFEVARYATKTNIKNAVEKLFGVKVIGVYTTNVKGTKNRRTRFGITSINASYKKARVQLAKGQKIDIFEESTDEKKTKKETKKKDK